jgi:hypothetical protein
LLSKKSIFNLSQIFGQVSYNLYFTLRDLGADSIIVIYQMGKVGSTTLTETLGALSLKMPIYQVHHLTEEGLKLMDYNAMIRERPVIRRRAYWSGKHLQRRLKPQAFYKKTWYVLTLTRDPVARNISGFFHLLKRDHPNLYADFGVIDNETLFPRLKDTFLLDFRHNKPLEWFDNEIKNVLNIDLYKQPFPSRRGYDIIQKENVRLLILRLEDLNACIQPALESWLGKSFDSILIVSANRADEKPYESYYHAFNNWLVLPDDYLHRMYESKFARHFYSTAELDRFFRGWAGLDRQNPKDNQA